MNGDLTVSFEIRGAVRQDFNDICNLAIQVHDLHLKNRPDVYVDVDNSMLENYLDGVYNDTQNKLFVVENTDSNELVAFCIIKMMTTQSIPLLIQRRFALIENFCVKSGNRGKGIGKLLFQHTVNYAREQGASSLELVVWEFNQDAIRFYDSMGMTTRNRKMELDL